MGRQTLGMTLDSSPSFVHVLNEREEAVYLRLDDPAIAVLKHLMEAHDNLAMLRTIAEGHKAAPSVVALLFSTSMRADLERFLRDLQAHVVFHRLSEIPDNNPLSKES